MAHRDLATLLAWSRARLDDPLVTDAGERRLWFGIECEVAAYLGELVEDSGLNAR